MPSGEVKSPEDSKQMSTQSPTINEILLMIIAHSLERALRDPTEKLMILDSLHTKDGHWFTTLPICTISQPTSQKVFDFITAIRGLKANGESFNVVNVTTPTQIVEKVGLFQWQICNSLTGAFGEWPVPGVYKPHKTVEVCKNTEKDIPSITGSDSHMFTSCLHIKTFKFCNSFLTIDPSTETIVFHWVKPFKTFEFKTFRTGNRVYSANENGSLSISFDDFRL